MYFWDSIYFFCDVWHRHYRCRNAHGKLGHMGTKFDPPRLRWKAKKQQNRRRQPIFTRPANLRPFKRDKLRLQRVKMCRAHFEISKSKLVHLILIWYFFFWFCYACEPSLNWLGYYSTQNDNVFVLTPSWFLFLCLTFLNLAFFFQNNFLKRVFLSCL